jgi:putative phosphoribosyl transferase
MPQVSVVADQVQLTGDLELPERPRGVVLFAHGSGSSRLSPRNRHVAAALNERGLGTLLIDLLTSDEERVDELTRELRFDIRLLAARLSGCIDWLADDPRTADLPLGLFGASTGAAAALIAAADAPDRVRAVVSRGGRPDLAGEALGRVRAPTLLIVGGRDEVVLELNRRARAQLRGESDLVVVPGATHLFEERGALDEVARLAGEWFSRFLGQELAGEEGFEPSIP